MGRYKILSIVIVFVTCYLLTAPALAASLIIDTESQHVSIKENFTINIFIDSEKENINALEGNLDIPDVLVVDNIITGGSVVTFWVEQPRVENNKVVWSGVMPGGFNSDKGLLFSLLVHAIREGSGYLSFSDLNVLLNDGKGTPTVVSGNSLDLSASGTVPLNTTAPIVADTTPPEPFSPQFSKNINIFNGQWFISFATQDKGWGMDHYEVAEKSGQPVGSYDNLPWRPVTSPYLLEDQTLRSTVYLKAVDKAGNERVVVIPPQPMSSYEKILIWGIMIIVLLAILLIVNYRYRPKHENK